MSAEAEQLLWLRIGLRFCSPGWRASIERRIAALEGTKDTKVPASPQQASGERGQRPAPLCSSCLRSEPDHPDRARPARDVKPGEIWAFTEHRTLAEADAAIAGDWRERRRALRQAGVEIKQFDGVLYVDGVRSDDPGLLPP